MFSKVLNRIINYFDSKLVVLCYHRVAVDSLDPWNLVVSPSNFEKQLQLLKNKYKVIPIDSIQEEIKKTSRSKLICITIDDGYVDNYTCAKDLLEKYSLPASFFITTKYTDRAELFWWDELMDMILEKESLPSFLKLEFNDQYFEFDNTEGAILNEDQRLQLRSWKPRQGAVNKRSELYIKLWQILISLTPEVLTSVLADLREWSGYLCDRDVNDRLPMSAEQLKSLSENALFTLGLHTANHIALDLQPFYIQENELLESKKELESIIQEPAKSISFPFGRYNEHTLELVKRYELDFCFTSGRAVFKRNSRFNCVARFAVGDWDAEKLEQKLEAWLRNY